MRNKSNGGSKLKWNNMFFLSHDNNRIKGLNIHIEFSNKGNYFRAMYKGSHRYNRYVIVWYFIVLYCIYSRLQYLNLYISSIYIKKKNFGTIKSFMSTI